VLTLTSGDGGWDYALGATWNITKNLSIGAQYVGVDGTSINGFSDDTVVGTLKLSF
jgi:opacity protein-like surface antigen